MECLRRFRCPGQRVQVQRCSHSGQSLEHLRPEEGEVLPLKSRSGHVHDKVNTDTRIHGAKFYEALARNRLDQTSDSVRERLR